MTPPSLVPGFALNRKIAEGGCSEIYEGEELVSKRKVAIKILHPRHAGNKEEYKRLLAEGALGLSLAPHPHLIQTLKVGKTGKAGACPYVVLEFAPGRTLREILRERRHLNNAEIVNLAGALGRALLFLHSAGVFHKDLKPENVMWDGHDSVKVIDLGFAERAGGGFWGLFKGPLEGSPAYMSPELIRTKSASAVSDLYALGCTLYEAATGRLPFLGSSDAEVLAKQLHMSLKPDPIFNANPEITLFTQKLILIALEKDLNLRYRSVNEFLLELSRNPVLKKDSSSTIPMGWTRKARG